MAMTSSGWSWYFCPATAPQGCGITQWGAARGEASGGEIPMRGSRVSLAKCPADWGCVKIQPKIKIDTLEWKSRLEVALHFAAEAFSGRLIQRKLIYGEENQSNKRGESDESSCSNRQTRRCISCGSWSGDWLWVGRHPSCFSTAKWHRQSL